MTSVIPGSACASLFHVIPQLGFAIMGLYWGILPGGFELEGRPKALSLAWLFGIQFLWPGSSPMRSKSEQSDHFYDTIDGLIWYSCIL